jgi:hypothetical protein
MLLSPLQKIGLYAVLVALVFGFGYYKGYSNQRDKFVDFKNELEAKAKAQDMLNKATEQKNKLIAENVKNEYEARLAALRNYYVGLRNADTNKLPRVPDSTSTAYAETSNPVFVGQCAETTLQLISLQDWVRTVSK